LRILIVDDDEVFLDRMNRLLTLEDNFIITANSGTDALSKLDENKFELILTDLKMPGLSGVEFIEKVREKEINTIIIMITGYGTIESAVNAMKAGAYDYILKPFDLETLKSKLREVKTEIELRKDISSTNFKEKTRYGGIADKVTLDDYTGPFLIVSDINPNKIIDKYKIEKASSIWLGYEDQENSIPPSKLNSIKSVIEDFIDKFETGTIIFKGIEEITKIHDWIIVKNFILYLQSKIASLNFSLLILLEEDSKIFDHSQDLLLKDTISLLKNPEITKIRK